MISAIYNIPEYLERVLILVSFDYSNAPINTNAIINFIFFILTFYLLFIY